MNMQRHPDTNAHASTTTYRVDTRNAGYDCEIFADNAEAALFEVAEHAGRCLHTDDGLIVDPEQTRGWTATQIAVKL